MSSGEAFEGADDIRRAWLGGLAPDPPLTVSQWADRHRILSSRAASEAGRYRTARTPFMRAIMDALDGALQIGRILKNAMLARVLAHLAVTPAPDIADGDNLRVKRAGREG